MDESLGNKITFGVEIETLMPDQFFGDNGIDIADYHTGRKIHKLGHILNGWGVEYDGSILRDNERMTHPRSAEWISPILSGVEGVNKVMDVVAYLKENGARVNNSTGFHVHVGAKSILGEEMDGAVEWVSNLLCLTSHYESVLLSVSGKASRIGNHYCESVKSHWQDRAPNGKYHNGAKKSMSDIEDDTYDVGRYCMLNIRPLFDSDNNTIEFRAFASTTTPRKAAGYIWLAVAIAHRATKIANPKFDESRSDYSKVVAATKKCHKALCGWGVQISGELFDEIVASQLIGAKNIQAQYPSATPTNDD